MPGSSEVNGQVYERPSWPTENGQSCGGRAPCRIPFRIEDLRKHTACVYSAELGIASAVSLNEEREEEEEEEEEEAPNLELDGVICYLLTITLRRDRNVCRPFSTESLQQ
ncbi:hypothetical protein HZH66_002967 [Vespula vulgaris]|uniref:Uncharacterized protein n=1 Tax=Vespula vulgaris TaxID=7454 RepID=A0A834KKR2_VESVU|nr:hypothetical protein HZH66_002967 [Vespula vulgaris]